MNENIRIALIPAYEPDVKLIVLLYSLRDSNFRSIVIDDGSGEKYAEIFRWASEFSTILTHPRNCGKGKAIKTALTYIREKFEEPYTVVTMDADGQHQISDAIRICDAAEKKPDTLILGSRVLKKKVPIRSRIGNSITRGVFTVSTGLHIHDTQTGLRAFDSRQVPAMLSIPGERYEYEMNVLLEFAHEKRSIEEIEIPAVYFDNNSGSHFDTVKDSYRIYKEIAKFSASSFLSFLTDYSLYSIFTVFTGEFGGIGLMASNVTARIVSSIVNFTLNRKFVFHIENNLWQSALKYFTLAAGILIGDTFVLNRIVANTTLNPYVAKLITEAFFFIISWFEQHLFVFRKEGKSRTRKRTA
ncbi:bifunctional glycosyltransferase family 2/GtrA family protein [Blautia liquoris]|uniref:Bifunctional glycosyltransferase family 2/GtrA family protein n=1 Tax=Blautia liquoris TaxID=2779518 RepID=A0A7M2RCV0_9FIRM|nr:bifunctional glycosyltransferase family 2/GtrA family protein [Blautia liquoris]QOV18155.1 bifunctional glycosyltransferase family 2/GtrA family protein [Blautia liquoris]